MIRLFDRHRRARSYHGLAALHSGSAPQLFLFAHPQVMHLELVLKQKRAPPGSWAATRFCL